MWKLANFVRARHGMTPEQLRDALAEHDWVPTKEEDAAAGYHWPEAAALSAATLAAGGDSDFSVDAAVDGAPVLSAHCCSMKLLGYSDCENKHLRKGDRKKKIDAAGQATTQPSAFWVCKSKCGGTHARECAKRSHAACVGAATVSDSDDGRGCADVQPGHRKRKRGGADCEASANAAVIPGGRIDLRSPPAKNTARVIWKLSEVGRFVTIVFEAQQTQATAKKLKSDSRTKEMFMIMILQVKQLAQTLFFDQSAAKPDVFDTEVLRFALHEFRDVLLQKWVPVDLRAVLFPEVDQRPRGPNTAGYDSNMIGAWREVMKLVETPAQQRVAAKTLRRLTVKQFNATMHKTDAYVGGRKNAVRGAGRRAATKYAQKSSEIWNLHATENQFLNFGNAASITRVAGQFRDPKMPNRDGSAKTKQQPRAKKTKCCGASLRGPPCHRTTDKASKEELAGLGLDPNINSKMLLQIPAMHVERSGRKSVVLAAQPFISLEPWTTDVKTPVELAPHPYEGRLRQERREALAARPGSGGVAKTLLNALGATRDERKMFGVQIQRLHAEGKLANGLSLVPPEGAPRPYFLGRFSVGIVEWNDGHDPGCGLGAMWVVDRSGKLLKDAIGAPIPVSNWKGSELHGIAIGNAVRSTCDLTQRIEFPNMGSYMEVEMVTHSRCGDFSLLCKADGHMPPGSIVAKPFQHPTVNGAIDSLVVGRTGLWSNDAGGAGEFQTCTRLDALTWTLRLYHAVRRTTPLCANLTFFGARSR